MTETAKRTLNHLVELKLAAVTHLDNKAAVELLGGWPSDREHGTCARSPPGEQSEAGAHEGHG